MISWREIANALIHPNLRILAVLPPIRNVWSAAVLQAKSERDMLVCANVSGLCWSSCLLA
jgi:hypothetical protein